MCKLGQLGYFRFCWRSTQNPWLLLSTKAAWLTPKLLHKNVQVCTPIMSSSQVTEILCMVLYKWKKRQPDHCLHCLCINTGTLSHKTIKYYNIWTGLCSRWPLAVALHQWWDLLPSNTYTIQYIYTEYNIQEGTHRQYALSMQTGQQVSGRNISLSIGVHETQLSIRSCENRISKIL